MPAKKILDKVVRVELHFSPEQISKLDEIVVLAESDRNKTIRALVENGWEECVRCGLIKRKQAVNEPANQAA
jgi:hypothetical protein